MFPLQLPGLKMITIGAALEITFTKRDNGLIYALVYPKKQHLRASKFPSFDRICGLPRRTPQHVPIIIHRQRIINHHKFRKSNNTRGLTGL